VGARNLLRLSRPGHRHQRPRPRRWLCLRDGRRGRVPLRQDRDAGVAAHRLGRLPGYSHSEAGGVDDRGWVIGAAYVAAPDGTSRRRTLLYDNGLRLRDLNALIPADSDVTLVSAADLNDAG